MSAILRKSFATFCNATHCVWKQTLLQKLYNSTDSLPRTTQILIHHIHSKGRSHVNIKENESLIQDTEHDKDISPRRMSSLDVPKTSSFEHIDLAKDIQELRITEKKNSVLEPCKEDISSVAPYFVPTFNFAAYINKSPTLQEFLKLGVDLHKLEKKKGIPQYVLKLDFDRDMKHHIRFLDDVGVESDELGRFLTRNPLIFKVDLKDLEIRINYLQSKKFSTEMISRVVSQNPHWLMFSTQRIDHRLGHFQTTFKLSGNEVRALSARQPRLITYNMHHVKVNTFVIKEELGFTEEEMKNLLLNKPNLWMINQISLKKRFDYVHNIMKIPHIQIVQQPQVLGSRAFRIEQRHLFLQELGRAQYDPHKEGYVSLVKLVSEKDAVFCRDIANTSVHTFNSFLKTL